MNSDPIHNPLIGKISGVSHVPTHEALYWLVCRRLNSSKLSAQGLALAVVGDLSYFMQFNTCPDTPTDSQEALMPCARSDPRYARRRRKPRSASEAWILAGRSHEDEQVVYAGLVGYTFHTLELVRSTYGRLWCGGGRSGSVYDRRPPTPDGTVEYQRLLYSTHMGSVSRRANDRSFDAETNMWRAPFLLGGAYELWNGLDQHCFEFICNLPQCINFGTQFNPKHLAQKAPGTQGRLLTKLYSSHNLFWMKPFLCRSMRNIMPSGKSEGFILEINAARCMRFHGKWQN